MKFGVVRFPGSNCDDDALRAVKTVLAHAGTNGKMIWHKETELCDVDAVIVPGGFSYGDYLRAGAIAAHSPVMAAVKRFAEAGGPVLGICNGFQVLCESGLLEGSLTKNQTLKFSCHDVYLTVSGRPTAFTHSMDKDSILRMPIAHSEGRYVHANVAALQAEGKVIFRYCSKDGHVGGDSNPNGSDGDIAGICNTAGNVVGLMPHPERAVETLLGSGEDGRALFYAATSWSTPRASMSES